MPEEEQEKFTFVCVAGQCLELQEHTRHKDTLKLSTVSTYGPLTRNPLQEYPYVDGLLKHNFD
jgi:hypothetical protein